MSRKRCPECGLSYDECDAITYARIEAEASLRRSGWSGKEARAWADALAGSQRARLAEIEGEGR